MPVVTSPGQHYMLKVNFVYFQLKYQQVTREIDIPGPLLNSNFPI